MPSAGALINLTALRRLAYAFLAIVAGWVFFHGLGRANLTDWDEAWHAQIASEIISRGDWLWLHYRGLPYFNKPPLTFWLKAIAFRVGGVNEASARFFPALFGYASVMATAWFFGKVLDRRAGLLAGFILCTSWLFTLHHAGRSGETDSTLIFFHILTFISLWHAQQNSGWFYIAGVCTALGWMTKGSTAYLIWPVMLLGKWFAHMENRRNFVGSALTDGISPTGEALISGTVPSAKADPTNSTSPNKHWFRHAIGGLILSICLTLPWQGLMLAQHGRAFANAFYVGEGALPAMHAIENHPGQPTFYIQIFHAFFEPWFLLAVATVVWVLWRKRGAIQPSVLFLIAWAGLILVACTLFATKMVWYATPALPPLAGLAAVAGIELSRRRAGWILLMAVAGFGVYQIHEQSWTPANQIVTAGLALLIGWTLARAPLALDRWKIWVSALCLAVPIAAHFNVIYGALVRGTSMADWTGLGVDDEPWREICHRIDRDFPGRPILLVGIPLNPAAYFYLHHLRTTVSVNTFAYERIGELGELEARSVIVTRTELADPLRTLHFKDEFAWGSLLIMQPASR